MEEARRRQQAGMMPGVGPQVHQIQVDISNATPQKCEKCGSEIFMNGIKAYIVSALVSPTGQELLAQAPVLVCMECKTVFNSKKGNGGEKHDGIA